MQLLPIAFEEVKSWKVANKALLNLSNTEVLLLSTLQQLKRWNGLDIADWMTHTHVELTLVSYLTLLCTSLTIYLVF